MMKKMLLSALMALSLGACAGTWNGVKTDANRASDKVGEKLNKAGDSIGRQWERTKDGAETRWNKTMDALKVD